jgi:hypothetical protein
MIVERPTLTYLDMYSELDVTGEGTPSIRWQPGQNGTTRALKERSCRWL